ncbi:MAG: DNA polymerase III subunit gamma/tau [Hyphomonadaceae bacterium]
MARKPAPPTSDGATDDSAENVRDDNTLSMFGEEASGSGGYQVLARKYRPRTFEDLAGQEAMVRTLTNAFRTGRVAHAFMLTGVRGVGKTTTARLLARALNYKTAETDAPSIKLDPPGEHCAAIMASQHPDVLELDAASHTGVADMRDLLDGARYAPVSARYKVYIIDEVHMLSTAAFNALLKTLEEPPPHVKFIFATTEIRKVPVTVLSRCQRFNLQRFSAEALGDHLAKICGKEGAKADPEALALIARAAEGSARDALSILDQAIVMGEGGSVSADAVRDMLGLADRSRVFDLMETIVGGDHSKALGETSSMLEAGADAPVLLRDLMDVSVEIARAQALKEAYSFAGPADWGKRTAAIAQQMTPAQSARMWRMLLQGFEDCQRAPDPASAAQMVVLRLTAASNLPPPEDAARLLAGEAGATGSAAPRTRSREGEPAPATSASRADAPADEDDPAVRFGSLRGVIAELDAAREISLKWEIERYVRPVDIHYGYFHYAVAEGAPPDLSLRIKTWLEDASHVEWQVAQTDGASADAPARETPAEARARRRRERFASAASHPMVARALSVFQHARILRVDDPEGEDAFAEPAFAESADGSNIIHVDFAGRGEAPPHSASSSAADADYDYPDSVAAGDMPEGGLYEDGDPGFLEAVIEEDDD